MKFPSNFASYKSATFVEITVELNQSFALLHASISTSNKKKYSKSFKLFEKDFAMLNQDLIFYF
jgi:hypothetical protein